MHGRTVRVTLDALNGLPAADFASALDGVFERAPWVASGAARTRPHATVAALHASLMDVVRAADEQTRLRFVAAHPDLAGQAARAGAVADLSAAEQAGLGLATLSAAEFTRFEALNARYRTRFGFPFVVCVRRMTRDAILDAFTHRLAHDRDLELACAIDEIGFITRLRLVDRVDGPGAPGVTGRLTTHVLDVANGRPASGVAVTLHEIGAASRGVLARAVTDAAGRTAAPLLGGAPLRRGRYELKFAIGAYYRALGTATASPPFFDIVPVRFSIAEPEGDYHVPLTVSPWSYTTYRGH